MSIGDRATGVTLVRSAACRCAGPLRILGASLLSLALLSPAFGQQAQDARQQQAQQEAFEQHRIDYLIDSVAALRGASFIRNGKAYDAAKAASHMRLKLRFAGSQVHTAEDFIVYCGTGSSVSGNKYTIRFADGQSIDSASFLRRKLAEYPPLAPVQAQH
jgi:hypothetical protein